MLAQVFHEFDEKWRHKFCQQKQTPDSAFEEIVIMEEFLPGSFRHKVPETKFKQHSQTDPPR